MGLTLSRPPAPKLHVCPRPGSDDMVHGSRFLPDLIHVSHLPTHQARVAWGECRRCPWPGMPVAESKFAVQHHAEGSAAHGAGLSPEVVMMYDSMDKASEMMPNPPYNILRPESVETFFYLWRITGDDMYRDWCWK